MSDEGGNRDALTRWVEGEQRSLWADLGDALGRAANGVWSIECGNIACRVAAAARLVGPTPCDEISWPLVAGGVYEAVLRAGAVDHAPVGASWLAHYEPRMRERGGTVAECRQRNAATVAAIMEPREAGFIRDGDD